MAIGDAYVFPGFLTPVLTTFLSKATDYFSHMLLHRLEAKIRRKEKSPQTGIEPPGDESDTLNTEPPSPCSRYLRSSLKHRYSAFCSNLTVLTVYDLLKWQTNSILMPAYLTPISTGRRSQHTEILDKTPRMVARTPTAQ